MTLKTISSNIGWTGKEEALETLVEEIKHLSSNIEVLYSMIETLVSFPLKS